MVVDIICIKKYDDRLILLGDIVLAKENWKNQSFCYQDEDHFDYHGIDFALCGKIGWIPKRILVIQMK